MSSSTPPGPSPCSSCRGVVGKPASGGCGSASPHLGRPNNHRRPGSSDAMNELTTLTASLGTRLKERKETLAVAESSAGGLISAALLAVPGASAYFLGGAVIYTQAARRALLRVPGESGQGGRSSTGAYALLQARAIRELLDA